jgi:hypothetical protein
MSLFSKCNLLLTRLKHFLNYFYKWFKPVLSLLLLPTPKIFSLFRVSDYQYHLSLYCLASIFFSSTFWSNKEMTFYAEQIYFLRWFKSSQHRLPRILTSNRSHKKISCVVTLVRHWVKASFIKSDRRATIFGKLQIIKKVLN